MEERIFASEPKTEYLFFMGVGKIKIPKTVNDVLCVTGNGIRIRIIFKKICDNKVLVGDMTAGTNR